MTDDQTGLAEHEDTAADADDQIFGVGAEEPTDDDLDAPARAMSMEEQLEDTLATLEQVTSERDDYLNLAQRLQADFENYKRRIDLQRDEVAERATDSLVSDLLPVLDACDAAVAHGAADVAPVEAQLTGILTKRGLSRVDETDVTFDPNVHEAVLSEPGAEGQDGPEVAEIMRAGYLWNGRVVRPAMVKVRG